MVNFAEMFRKRTELCGKSRRELARALGYSAPAISQICTGRHKPPLDRMPAWAEALGLTGAEREEFLLLARLEHTPPELRDLIQRTQQGANRAADAAVAHDQVLASTPPERLAAELHEHLAGRRPHQDPVLPSATQPSPIDLDLPAEPTPDDLDRLVERINQAPAWVRALGWGIIPRLQQHWREHGRGLLHRAKDQEIARLRDELAAARLGNAMLVEENARLRAAQPAAPPAEGAIDQALDDIEHGLRSR